MISCNERHTTARPTHDDIPLLALLTHISQPDPAHGVPKFSRIGQPFRKHLLVKKHGLQIDCHLFSMRARLIPLDLS